MNPTSAQPKVSTVVVYYDRDNEVEVIRMKRKLEMELDFVTDLPPLEFASKITPLLREAIEAMKQTLGSELEFDIFLVLDGNEVHLVMESV